MILIICLSILIVGIAVTLFATKTEQGRKLFGFALDVYIQSRGNIKVARRMVRTYTAGMSQVGALSIETIIYIFVALIILYQLIPQVSQQNTTIQASGNVSAMGKFASGLGEWLFPLFGILALVFLLWRTKGGKGGGKKKGGT